MNLLTHRVTSRIIDAMKKGKKTALLSMIKNGINEITPEKVFLAAKKGDQLSLELVKDAGRYLGIAISDFANLLNIKTIILYGGLVSSFSLFAKRMKEEIIKRTIPSFSKEVRVLKAGLMQDAGIIGAAGVVFQKNGLLRFCSVRHFRNN